MTPSPFAQPKLPVAPGAQPSSTALTLGTPSASPSGPSLDALLDAIDSERRLIDELAAVMRRQRSAVAADDLQSVDDSVFATHRILLTLNEARRRRHALNRLFGDPGDGEARTLEELLGDRMTDELRQARANLQIAAVSLSAEVETNRQVLRQALATGDEYVRALYGAAPTAASHGPYAADIGRPAGEPRGGLLVNRRA